MNAIVTNVGVTNIGVTNVVATNVGVTNVGATNFVVTERAARRIAEIAAGEPAMPALRVAVEGGGCSGRC